MTTEPSENGLSYAAAGVDINAGDRAVDLMRASVAGTARPEVMGGIGGFAGLFDASRLASYRHPVLATSTDGVGTKVVLASQLGVYDTVGMDLVAMVADDLAACGAEPLFMTDYVVCGAVQDSIDQGRAVEETGPRASRNRLQTVTLLDAIAEHGFDAAFGGARRDEERARAKERVFSFRDDFGQWEPKRQRPEVWALFNGRIRKGEHVRVFPLSNWTELDVWQYIGQERLEVPTIYFAHTRQVFERDGMLYAMSQHVQLIEGESPFEASVRYRTVGDMTCTGAVRSYATTLPEVVSEIAATRVTEAAMEDRKREGYF